MEIQKKILLIDDEDIIIEVTEGMLVYLGYEVKIAKDSNEALKIFTQAFKENNYFDLIIVDLCLLNGVSGYDLFQKIIKIDPNAKTIISSGYSTDPMIENYKNYGFSGAITKPYKLDDLIKVLNSVFESKEKT
ncbi:MAG: response regulator [Desulfobacterales bacterium]|nr:response regulator [Desulfobacterales bacterium]